MRRLFVVLVIIFTLLVGISSFVEGAWKKENIGVSDIKASVTNLLTGESWDGFIGQWGKGKRPPNDFHMCIWKSDGAWDCNKSWNPLDIQIIIFLHAGQGDMSRFLQLAKDMGFGDYFIPRILKKRPSLVRLVLKDGTTYKGTTYKGSLAALDTYPLYFIKLSDGGRIYPLENFPEKRSGVSFYKITFFGFPGEVVE